MSGEESGSARPALGLLDQVADHDSGRGVRLFGVGLGPLRRVAFVVRRDGLVLPVDRVSGRRSAWARQAGPASRRPGRPRFVPRTPRPPTGRPRVTTAVPMDNGALRTCVHEPLEQLPNKTE